MPQYDSMYYDSVYGQGPSWRGATRDLLAGGSEAAAALGELLCNGPTPVRVGTCPDGQEPMLTYKTLEQVGKACMLEITSSAAPDCSHT